MDKRIVKTKQNIYDCLNQLLFEKDLNDISITELAERASISRKTFYLHYSTINDVINEQLEDLSNNITERISKIKFDRNKNTYPEIQEITIEESLKKEVLINAIISQKNCTFIKTRYNQIQSKLVSEIIYKKYQVTKEESILYGTFIVNTIYVAIRNWLYSGKEMPIEDLKKLVSSYINFGETSIPRNKSIDPARFAKVL